MTDKCEKAWKLGRLGEMYDLLKKLQIRGEYNDSRNILRFSEERFKEHSEKLTENRHETDVTCYSQYILPSGSEICYRNEKREGN